MARGWQINGFEFSNLHLFFKQGEWHLSVLEGPVSEYEFKLHPDASTWSEDILKQNGNCGTNERRPVFWFGLDGDDSAPCWIIDVYNLGSDGDYSDVKDCLISWFEDNYWEEIIADTNSWIGYCEAEFGVRLPSKSQLLKNLPVKIRDGMSKIEFISAVNEYFLEKIREVQ